jgi:hypothetical protein
MGRPVGVTLIAVLDFLAMVLQIALGLGLLLGMGVLGSILSKNLGHNPQFSSINFVGLLTAFGAVFAVFVFVFAVISALLGWGMMALKNWARIISIAYSGIGILFFGFGMLMSLLRFRPMGVLWDGLWLAINGLIIWYLLQPDVRAVFAGRPRSVAATA